MFPHLPRAFYQRDAVTVARSLLGQRLVRPETDRGRMAGDAGGSAEKRTAGIIVETEAYLGLPDKGAHTYNGRYTARNASMWGEGGHAYVYFTYGMHHCLNAVAGSVDQPVAVLIRALEPTEGLDTMYTRRDKAKRDPDLCSGPAKLCQALAIDRTLNGSDLVHGETLFIEQLRQRAMASKKIVVGPRIGIDYAEEWTNRPLRFCVADNPHLSKRAG